MANYNINEDPRNWTKEYVSSHWSECLLFLRELNLGTVRHIEEQHYCSASLILDGILNGFDALKKSNGADSIRSCLAAYSCTMAELTALVDPVAFEREIRDMNVQPDFQGKSAAGYLRDVAIMGFEDTLDYAKSSGMRSYATSMIRALKAGNSIERIRRDYAPDFPKDIQDVLLKLDDDFFVPTIMQCAPERCLVLDKNRLIFRQKLVGNEHAYAPANICPVEMPADVSVKTPPRARPDNDFEAWVDGNGWDEDDLEQAYKRVKLRRNIYGVLSLTPLGLILFPFWLRAMYLTKAMKNRSINVKLNTIAWIICIIYTICTFFVYAAVMIWIIKKTNWGMGLGDRRALIPTIAVVVLVAVLFFQSNTISFPDIGGLVKSISGTHASDTKRENTPPEPGSDLTDQELLNLASEILNSDAELCIANAGFLETDDSDCITVTDEWGERRFYRVIGCDTIAEAEEAAIEFWHETYSRRMAFNVSGHSMDLMHFQLMEQDGKLYWFTGGGVGDSGEYYEVVDRMISRTNDEAVFLAHSVSDYIDDSIDTSFQFSLVLEEGGWKYLGEQE